MKNRRKGFTLVELLLVISVMALLATLTIGGVLKATKSARKKRVDAMCKSLTIALTSYKAQVGRWPVQLDPGTINGANFLSADSQPYDKYKAFFTGEENKLAFEDLIPKKGQKKAYYLSPSEFLTKPKGYGVMPLSKAIDKGLSSVPLGYADPEDQSQFRYFKVEFNLWTDSVTVKKYDDNS